MSDLPARISLVSIVFFFLIYIVIYIIMDQRTPTEATGCFTPLHTSGRDHLTCKGAVAVCRGGSAHGKEIKEASRNCP